ncbi:MAG: 6-bladed beta-propeller [Candidatus Aminicenantes bacterium]|nr:6-bladed beta-propeller [Candidatus Aminicenantes bacterium]
MKNKFKVISTVLFLSAFIMVISFGGQKAEWKGKIEVKNGIKIVKNPKMPIYGNEIFSIEEDLKIGEVESDENYMFSQIRNFVIDKNENIYVADVKETYVKVFDKNGEFLKVFGKEGEGPGEIGRISSIHINAKNELLVHDSRNRKIQYFSLEGKFVRSKNLGKIRPLRLYCDYNENYYVTTAVIDPPNSRYVLLKYDNDLNLIATIAKIPAPDPTKPFNPFMPFFYYQLMNDDCLLYGYPESYELHIFNPEGKIIKKIIRDYNPVPVSEAEKEEMRKDIRPGRKLEFPRYHSAFVYFKIDEEGRIFVQTWEKPESGEEYCFDVFDSDGRYIAKIPLNFRLAVMKKSKIYTIEEDEDGYQYIKRYKVTWKY